jgi:hypothetical protein
MAYQTLRSQLFARLRWSCRPALREDRDPLSLLPFSLKVRLRVQVLSLGLLPLSDEPTPQRPPGAVALGLPELCPKVCSGRQGVTSVLPIYCQVLT